MVEWSRWVTQHPVVWWIAVSVIGLCVGSLLNVVVYRLPIMQHNAWLKELEVFNGQIDPPSTAFNLFLPRSHCPHCHHVIAVYDNIPLFSWLLLKARCRDCHKPIHWRYPLIELLTLLMTLLTAVLFPPGLLLLGAWLFAWFLLALAVIDVDTLQLPDQLTLSLLWLGLLFNLDNGYVGLQDAVLGTVSGYLALWLLYWGFKLITGREGLGYGDFKLLAALGAWLGWQVLPELLILAALIGLVQGVFKAYRDKSSVHRAIPFGPALAFSGWLMLLYQQTN